MRRWREMHFLAKHITHVDRVPIDATRRTPILRLLIDNEFSISTTKCTSTADTDLAKLFRRSELVCWGFYDNEVTVLQC